MPECALSRVTTRPFVTAAPATRLPTAASTVTTQRVHHIVSNDTVHTVSAAQVSATPPSMWRIAVHATATFAVVLTVGLVCLATVPMLFGYRPVVVTSGSMNPAIRTADVVMTSATDGRDLDAGTVVNHDAGDATTLHRIVEVTDSGYRTAGDANQVADSTIVTPEDIRGVGVVVVPFVGRAHLWLHSRQWLPLALMVAIVGFACNAARPSWLKPAGAQW